MCGLLIVSPFLYVCFAFTSLTCVPVEAHPPISTSLHVYTVIEVWTWLEPLQTWSYTFSSFGSCSYSPDFPPASAASLLVSLCWCASTFRSDLDLHAAHQPWLPSHSLQDCCFCHVAARLWLKFVKLFLLPFEPQSFCLPVCQPVVSCFKPTTPSPQL